MAVLVDLESDDDDSALLARYVQQRDRQSLSNEGVLYGSDQDEGKVSFAAVLTCYPYANTDNHGRKTTRYR